MSEIGPGRLMEALTAPAEPGRRAAASAAPAHVFADLLRTLTILSPPTTAEAFEANDLVGRAELSLRPDPPETEQRHPHLPAPEMLATASPALKTNDTDRLPDAARSIDALPIAVEARRHAARTASLPGGPTGPVRESSASPAASLQDSPSRPEQATPMAPAESGQVEAVGSQSAIARSDVSIPSGPRKLASPEEALAATRRAAPPSASQAGPASLQSRPASESPPREAAAQKQGGATAEKVRLYLLEHARTQANSSAIHVVVVATDNGLRVVARVGAMEEGERLRLRNAIAAMLDQHGVSDIDIVIQTASPSETGARQG